MIFDICYQNYKIEMPKLIKEINLILVDNEDWNNMKNNKTNKIYVNCSSYYKSKIIKYKNDLYLLCKSNKNSKYKKVIFNIKLLVII